VGFRDYIQVFIDFNPATTTRFTHTDLAAFVGLWRRRKRDDDDP